jgi:hypothetical protein
MAKARLTEKQRHALQIAVDFGRVIQHPGDSIPRPDHAAGVTLESLRGRGLLEPYEGPRYMPVYLITDAGREALGLPAKSITVHTVTFTRIGRTKNVQPLQIPVPTGKDADEYVVPAIVRYARKFLLSGGFDVTLDRERVNGMIEYGRFGQFTITQEA